LTEGLAERIADQLRREILIGRFPPGSSIKERDNAARLGVSRTPMREATRILAKEGLVILRPARSPIVAEPGFNEISDAIDVLLALERLAVSQACERATDQGLSETSKIHEDLTANYHRLDELDLFEQDMAFHSKIVEITGNRSLFATYKIYRERLWRTRFLAARQDKNRQKMLQEHGDIVVALKNRDPDAAVAATTVHLGKLGFDIKPLFLKQDSAEVPSNY
jgi:DNA-binding GntR family transcriptional regulator